MAVVLSGAAWAGGFGVCVAVLEDAAVLVGRAALGARRVLVWVCLKSESSEGTGMLCGSTGCGACEDGESDRGSPSGCSSGASGSVPARGVAGSLGTNSGGGTAWLCAGMFGASMLMSSSLSTSMGGGVCCVGR